jgi:hypothetical protein
MMIHCPYQASQLMISKRGCIKLHARRSEVPLEDVMICDFFNFSLRKDLLIYWGCLIKKRLEPLHYIY